MIDKQEYQPRNESAIWITWENQVRNKTLSKEIGAELYQVESKKSRVIRYIQLTFTTFNLFRKTRAKVIIVQNPSLILALVSNLFSRLFRKSLAVDAHNGGLFPLDGKYLTLNFLAKVLVKITPLTLVSNNELKKYVESQGGRAMVVPDPLPAISPINDSKKNDVYKAVFVCTWASDEPFEEVIKAASFLPKDIEIYITGNHKGRVTVDKDIYPNVILTGYISDLEYVDLMNSADVTIDLTTRDNCLVCGAYESVSLEKPMILSNKKALRSYFNKGALYAENNADDIANKIIESKKLNRQLMDGVKILKQEKIKDWECIKKELLSQLCL